MSKRTFALKYLARTAAGVPRDLANTLIVSKIHPIRPTVLIYNCTWVCDARCEMCNNWKHGDRKSDMTLEQLEPAMNHPFWGAIENLNISGGEPTTRNDLPEMVEMFHRHLPRMRKVGMRMPGSSRASLETASRRGSQSRIVPPSIALSTGYRISPFLT